MPMYVLCSLHIHCTCRTQYCACEYLHAAVDIIMYMQMCTQENKGASSPFIAWLHITMTFLESPHSHISPSFQVSQGDHIHLLHSTWKHGPLTSDTENPHGRSLIQTMHSLQFPLSSMGTCISVLHSHLGVLWYQILKPTRPIISSNNELSRIPLSRISPSHPPSLPPRGELTHLPHKDRTTTRHPTSKRYQEKGV